MDYKVQELLGQTKWKGIQLRRKIQCCGINTGKNCPRAKVVSE
jgi:hypothetical protein